MSINAGSRRLSAQVRCSGAFWTNVRGVANSAGGVGRDVFRQQLRFRSGAVGPGCRSPSAAACRHGLFVRVDLDLEKFFDRVNHDKLMGRIAKRVEDKRLLKLIRTFLNAGVMESGKRFIGTNQKLEVKESKSVVAKPQERKFLRSSFTGKELKRKVAPKAMDRFKERIRGWGREQAIEEPARYIRGWRGYFGFCQTCSALGRLDSWIRRRVRCAFCRQWEDQPHEQPTHGDSRA